MISLLQLFLDIDDIGNEERVILLEPYQGIGSYEFCFRFGKGRIPKFSTGLLFAF